MRKNLIRKYCCICNSKLKKIISKKDVCMANADQVKINTGFSIGGVSPIAHLKKLNIFLINLNHILQKIFSINMKNLLHHINLFQIN